MVEIAHAPSSERAEIADFMCKWMPRVHWDIKGWNDVLSGRWADPGDTIAVTARDNGTLVGVIGLVKSHRMTSDGRRKIGNLTSWYVLKDYRGQGIGGDIMRKAISRPEETVTNLTSAKGPLELIKRIGFEVLDDQSLCYRPRPSQPNRFEVTHYPLSLGDVLAPQDRQILQDHIGLPVYPMAVKTPDGWCVIVVAKHKKHDEYVTWETMYLGQPKLFAQHAHAIAASILPDTGAVLAVDRRFTRDGTEYDYIYYIPVPRYYTKGRMNPHDIDNLYSEVAMLNMKLY
jgi:predicted N-acetyltransferase YhbS